MLVLKETPVEFARWLDTQVVSWRDARTPVQRYGVAIALMIMAASLWYALGPDLAREARWIVFVLAVAATFIVVGVGPGLVTVGLCTVFGLYFSGRPGIAAMLAVAIMFILAATFAAWTRSGRRFFPDASGSVAVRARNPDGTFDTASREPASRSPGDGRFDSPHASDIGTRIADSTGGYSESPDIEIGAVLAHEISQPLSAISNYAMAAQKCLQGKVDADSLAALDAVSKVGLQARRAADIVAGLPRILRRDFSTRRTESLARVIEEVLELAQASPKAAEIAFRLRIDPAAEFACIDKVQIQQVMYNVVRNAIEAMAQSDTKALTITTRAILGDRIEISVADTGSGIPAEILPRLFNPVTSRKPNGMGLGLSISRTILDLHGGTITADANPSGGAIFRIALPVECGEGPGDAG